MSTHSPRSTSAASTRGRGRRVKARSEEFPPVWSDPLVHLYHGDALDLYDGWPDPTIILSDGGYGVLGFEGDTTDHHSLADWYAPHIEEWGGRARPFTTLWFWNSEIGWAVVHPLLERAGFRYASCNVWAKGKGHIAGNVNTQTIRRFPVVTEVCAQYVFEARVDGRTLQQWLRHEWQRTGLPLRRANEACGVRDAAVRKYLDGGHLWYFPPPEMFARLVEYANTHGEASGRPYFAPNDNRPMTGDEWTRMRAPFHCPHGFTNVWERPALRGKERILAPNGRAAHLNQKPLDLTEMLIAASSDPGDVIWEPFGGLFTTALAARSLKRRCYSAEMEAAYFQIGLQRLRADSGSEGHQ